MNRSFLGVISIMVVSSAPALAAPTAEAKASAKRFFEAGRALHEQGSFAEAARQFELAWEQLPTPEFSYNAAQDWDKAGARKEAIADYKRFLDSGKAGNRTKLVTARIEILERELAEQEKLAARAKDAEDRVRQAARGKPAALPFTEPSTKQVFQTYLEQGGAGYSLLGVGVRKVLGATVYAMALYVEDEPARRAFPQLATRAGGADQRSLGSSPATPLFVIDGDFSRLTLLRFTRAVDQQQLQKSYRKSLAASLDGKAPPEVRREAEAFVALFDRDMKEGEEMTIRAAQDGQLWLALGGGSERQGPKSRRLARDVLSVWLGENPLSEELKKSLLGRAEALGR